MGQARAKKTMDMQDLEFCRRHLAAWCKEQQLCAARRAQIWGLFLRNPSYYFDNNIGWPALHRMVLEKENER